MTVKRFALLVAAGVLWLFVAALPAFADGGPHVMTVNNGTSGMNGDCASCHRAHTAEAADLLTADMPALCTNCHNGTKATTDVVDGVQFTPTGVGGTYQQATTLGALRGGGFSYALMGSAARLSTGGSQTIVLSAGPASGSFTLTFNGQTTGAIAWNATAATFGTNITNALFALSSVNNGVNNTTYAPAGVGNSGTTYPQNITAAYTAATRTITLTMRNQFAISPQPLVSVGSNTLVDAGAAAVTTTVADTTQSAVREAGYIGVKALANKTATTSTHEGLGTVWGNGAVNSGAGATGVTLDCAKCHNPHGNGQYRILQTEPGEDWAAPYVVTNAGGVEVKEVTPTTLTGLQVRNYTVNPSTDGLTSGIVGTITQGDYWRYKFDTNGVTNFTNFYLAADPMNSGWTGLTPVNKAGNAGVAPANSTGLMTAWCIQCHTWYNGYNVTAAGAIGGSSTWSLVAQQPADTTSCSSTARPGSGASSATCLTAAMPR
ncbi:MAG: cytochrome c3 family protein [Chloroflexota bacterium]